MGRISYAGIFSLGMCAGLSNGLLTPPAAAQQTSMRVAAPHVEALRTQLGLSQDLRLEWLTSTNGIDTMRVTDDFNRSTIGDNWALNSAYWAIKNGELVLTSAAIYEWRYLAVFKPIFNTPERQIYSVSYRWGKKADAVGIGEGAHALMIDSPSYAGSGYWCWRRTNQNSVWLYAIKDGAWEYTPGESKEFNRAGSHLPIPGGGDDIEVVINNQPEAVYFDYYINGRWDATVNDNSKEFAQNPTWYAGVFIHGQDLNNQVDDFTITWLASDNVAPAAVTDLRATDSSATSVTLRWTAPGDNYFDGRPDHLEVRYSKNPITSNNFASATLASNIPSPANGGESQQFVIDGLTTNSKYYFALRAFDEVDNAGALSNIAVAHTHSSGIAQSVQMLSDCAQSGVVGTDLPIPVRVRVTDKEGFGVANYLVDFAITAGEGKIGGQTGYSASTDVEGVAAAIWTLGAVPGENRVEIIATDLQNSPLHCSATAVVGPPKQFVPLSGGRQLLSPNQVSQALLVRLVDAFDNGIAETSVTFSITIGKGKFVQATSSSGKRFKTKTDSEGKASALLQTSSDYGDSTAIVVQVDNNSNVPEAEFNVKTTVAETMTALSGDQQTGYLGRPLPEPIVVKISDQLGAPVPAYPVHFKVTNGNGTLPGGGAAVDILTDSSGQAETFWITGLGINKLEVSAAELQGSPQVFTATGLDSSSAVDESAGTLPQQFALLPNAPNPFNPSTTIHFTLPQQASVALEIFDLSGRRVRSLYEGTLAAGAHRIMWDGKDDFSRTLYSGVYFCRLRAHSSGANDMHIATHRLIMTK